jgi:NAD(P)-dependent dehydrogenase (short-subunit alcohol dehydrogenase family)
MPTLLVTGANRGIGLELCRQYIALDWDVYATCRDPDNAKALNELAQHSGNENLHIHALDVCNEQQMKDFKQVINDKPIDILLNNAGVFAKEQFGHRDEHVWEQAVNVNLLAPMKMMEHFVDNVAASDKRLIANMSSKMGSMNDNKSGGAYAYRATKAALNAVSVSAAHDLKHRDICVIILHPGWVKTDMGGENAELSVVQASSMLIETLSQVTMKESASFFDIDGSIIPW